MKIFLLFQKHLETNPSIVSFPFGQSYVNIYVSTSCQHMLQVK